MSPTKIRLFLGHVHPVPDFLLYLSKESYQTRAFDMLLAGLFQSRRRIYPTDHLVKILIRDGIRDHLQYTRDLWTLRPLARISRKP